MTQRLTTIFDELFPDSSPEFASISDAWPKQVIVEMFTLVWDAFDRLTRLPNFKQLDFSKSYAQLERSLTQLHAMQVTDLYAERRSGFESYVPQHEPWEFENLTDPRARPPASDIGFVFRANPRLCWSVEAKVLRKPTETGRYLGDLEKYLHATISPFATDGALGAYLLSGKPDDLLSAIESALQLPLQTYDAFVNRPHRFTEHDRIRSKLPEGAETHFVCHHLVFSLLQ